MIEFLIVDDDMQKAARICQVIERFTAPDDARISRAVNVADAMGYLRSTQCDLMIVDLNIPMRAGEAATPEGGLNLVAHLARKGTGLNTPGHIIGLTAFDDLLVGNRGIFESKLWFLLKYDNSSDAWSRQLAEKVVHIAETKHPEAVSNGYRTDLAIVTALHKVELESVLQLPCSWETHDVPGDDHVYHKGVLAAAGNIKDGSPAVGSKSLSVVAAAATEMGMANATALCMNMVHSFRPRYLAMVGIAAGFKKNKFGDILVATHSWDYGAGKLRYVEGRSEFLPAPSQVPLSPWLKNRFELFGMDESVCRDIQGGWEGARVPHELRVVRGPIASGAAVLESRDVLASIKWRDRKVIGVEMETYGVFVAARLCSEPRPQAMSVKSICDFGDERKNDKYQSYAAYTSAQYLHRFAQEFLVRRR